MTTHAMKFTFENMVEIELPLLLVVSEESSCMLFITLLVAAKCSTPEWYSCR